MTSNQEKRLRDLMKSSVVGSDIAAAMNEIDNLRKISQSPLQLLINIRIIKLIEDIMCGSGLLCNDNRHYTKPYSEKLSDNKKIKCTGNPQPGCRVKITWVNNNYPEFPNIEDHGYILTLPGCDDNDIFMSGIVHIPEPYDGFESNDPEWIYLGRLVSMDNVQQIDLY